MENLFFLVCVGATIKFGHAGDLVMQGIRCCRVDELDANNGVVPSYLYARGFTRRLSVEFGLRNEREFYLPMILIFRSPRTNRANTLHVAHCGHADVSSN